MIKSFYVVKKLMCNGKPFNMSEGAFSASSRSAHGYRCIFELTDLVCHTI